MGYAVGGAQKSLEILLGGLKDVSVQLLGCETQAFGATQLQEETTDVERMAWIQVPRLPYIEYLINRRRVGRFIHGHHGDVLITQGFWGAPAHAAFSGKKIYFVRDEYQLNRIPLYQRGVVKLLKLVYLFIQLPGILVLFRDNRRAIQEADLVIANSKYIQQEVKKKFGRDAVLLYSPVDYSPTKQVSEVPPFGKRPYLTLIGSEYMKGRPIIEALARRLPQQQFLIVGRNIQTEERCSNITFRPWTRDAEHIFSQTRILLIPSICNEAFPRVALEALARGIPVIGSNRGGTPEIVPPQWVVQDLWNIDEWREIIDRITQEGGVVDTGVRDTTFANFESAKQQALFHSLVHSLFV